MLFPFLFAFSFFFAVERILEPARLVVAVLLSGAMALEEAVVVAVLLSGAVVVAEAVVVVLLPGSVVLTRCPSSPLHTLVKKMLECLAVSVVRSQVDRQALPH